MENKNYLLFPFLAMGLLLGNATYGLYVVTTDTTEGDYDGFQQKYVEVVNREVDVHFGRTKPVDVNDEINNVNVLERINRQTDVKRINRDELNLEVWSATFGRFDQLSSIHFLDMKSSGDLLALTQTFQKIGYRLSPETSIHHSTHKDASPWIKQQASNLIEEAVKEIDRDYYRRLEVEAEESEEDY